MIRTLLILVAAAAMVVGCGKKKEVVETKPGRKVPERMAEQPIDERTGQPSKVQVTKEGMNMRAADGSYEVRTGENVEIPAEFPDAVPLYQGAKVAQVVTIPKGAHVVLTMTDPQSTVVAFYRETLEGDGWTSQMAMQMPGGEMLAYERGKENITVMVGLQDDLTHATITYGTK